MKTIILLEDEISLLKVMESSLRKEFPDVTIYATNDSAEAAQLIKKHNPDLVIADFFVPKMTGVEMVNVCRAGGWCGRAIILSNSTVENIPSGEYEFMAKVDTSLHNLKDVVRGALSPTANGPSTD